MYLSHMYICKNIQAKMHKALKAVFLILQDKSSTRVSAGIQSGIQDPVSE